MTSYSPEILSLSVFTSLMVSSAGSVRTPGTSSVPRGEDQVVYLHASKVYIYVYIYIYIFFFFFKAGF